MISIAHSKIIAIDNRPGGEVDSVAVSPIGGAAAGDVEHARDAPGPVVVVSHLSFYTLLSSWTVKLIVKPTPTS